jgi:hypothetical protein
LAYKESNGSTIAGPVRTLFANVRRVGQVDDFSAVAGDSVEIPEFIAGAVLLVQIRGARDLNPNLLGLAEATR